MQRIRHLVVAGALVSSATAVDAHDSLLHTAATQWPVDLYAVAGLSLSGLIYFSGLLRLWRHAGVGAGVARWRAMSFAAGLAVAAAAVLSPLAWLSDILFSAHMTQHELLMLVAAPLMVFGHPGIAAWWALPRRFRRPTALGVHAISGPWSFATSAAGAFLFHAVVIWAWHVPRLFNAALASDAVHAVQHISMAGTASLFWWGMVRGRYGRASYGASVFYVFATALHTGGLGAVLTFAPAAFYLPYESAARTWQIDPLRDQQLAGLLMWVPSALIFIIVGLALFAAWLGHSERHARQLAG